MSRVLVAFLAALLMGCRAFPVGLFIRAETIDILEESELASELPPDEIAQAMRERFGFEGDPSTVGAAVYHRLDLEPPPRPFRPAELDHGADGSLAGLRSGDLILAKNTKPQSLGTTLTMEEFRLYDHTGVLSEENGRFYVYESWPTLYIFLPAPDFASKFRGDVHRLPLSQFAARYETLELIRLPDPEKNQRLVEGARESIDEDIEYDPHHDPLDPALSCSEYILYLLREKAGYEVEVEATPVSKNPSLRRLVRSLGFHAERFIMPDSFAEIPGAKSVGILSRHDDLSKVLATRYAYEEIHGHFARNSVIGSYVTIDRWRLIRHRDSIQDFLDWTLGYFEERPTTDPDEIRNVLEQMVPIFLRTAEDSPPLP